MGNDKKDLGRRKRLGLVGSLALAGVLGLTNTGSTHTTDCMYFQDSRMTGDITKRNYMFGYGKNTLMLPGTADLADHLGIGWQYKVTILNPLVGSERITSTEMCEESPEREHKHPESQMSQLAYFSRS